MRYLEDLRGLYRGEKIWIIGAGASLDNYSTDFFENEICVGMNWVFSVFLDIGDGIEKFAHRAFYSVHQHVKPVDWIVRNLPGFLESCFLLLPPDDYRPALCTPSAGSRHSVWWGDYIGYGVHYMRWGIKGPNYVSATERDFIDVAGCIAGGFEYVSAGTTVHWAIQVAAVLGASEICLVGCEGFGPYASLHGSMYRDVAPTKPRSERIRGTENLIKAFASHGVDIAHHHCGGRIR